MQASIKGLFFRRATIIIEILFCINHFIALGGIDFENFLALYENNTFSIVSHVDLFHFF